MAVVSDAGGARITLGGRTLVGRSSDCLIRIDSRRVSAEHAVLSWSGKQWTLRDLGSKNGTLVDGKRVAPGARVSLGAGARFAFADAEWSLVDDRAPVARAVGIGSGQVVEEDGDGVLVLAESPLVFSGIRLVRGPSVGWWIHPE